MQRKGFVWVFVLVIFLFLLTLAVGQIKQSQQNIIASTPSLTVEATSTGLNINGELIEFVVNYEGEKKEFSKIDSKTKSDVDLKTDLITEGKNVRYSHTLSKSELSKIFRRAVNSMDIFCGISISSFLSVLSVLMAGFPGNMMTNSPF